MLSCFYVNCGKFPNGKRSILESVLTGLEATSNLKLIKQSMLAVDLLLVAVSYRVEHREADILLHNLNPTAGNYRQFIIYVFVSLHVGT